MVRSTKAQRFVTGERLGCLIARLARSQNRK
jgi:hypothetical protein